MSNITYVKGSLFDAPSGSIICHACNCKGVWGSGIAAQFAKRYPAAYREYKETCREDGGQLLGNCLMIDADNYTIGCLFTSRGFGANVDNEESILDATNDSIGDLIYHNTENKSIHMCKINSGLFGVPWEKTEAVLKTFPNQQFTVWEL